jgi:hypothetical protein
MRTFAARLEEQASARGPQPARWCSGKGSFPVDCEACDRALTPGQRCQGHVYRHGERDESEIVLVHTGQRTDDETEQRSRGNHSGQMAGDSRRTPPHQR